jgi:hypothetical protein
VQVGRGKSPSRTRTPFTCVPFIDPLSEMPQPASERESWQ